MYGRIEKITDINCTVGEGPIWNACEKVLHFIDIRGKCFYTMNLTGGKPDLTPLPQQIGFMALAENGSRLLAMEDGIYQMNREGALQAAHTPVTLNGRRFNDGKIGPDGRCYGGTTATDGNGAFYCLQDQKLVRLFGGVSCSNGLDWTMDGKTMYYCDSPLRKIERFDFFPGAETPLRNRRLCTDMRAVCGEGMPDGMTIDAKGKLWIALWGCSKAVRIDPDTAEILDQVSFPVERVSSCAFAGENLDQLIVTTAAFEADIAQQPDAGCVFRVKASVPGRAPYLYHG